MNRTSAPNQTISNQNGAGRMLQLPTADLPIMPQSHTPFKRIPMLQPSPLITQAMSRTPKLFPDTINTTEHTHNTTTPLTYTHNTVKHQSALCKGSWEPGTSDTCHNIMCKNLRHEDKIMKPTGFFCAAKKEASVTDNISRGTVSQ